MVILFSYASAAPMDQLFVWVVAFAQCELIGKLHWKWPSEIVIDRNTNKGGDRK